MKCPYCNTEMELGYIQCRDSIYWSDKKRKVAAIPPMGGKKLKLSSNATPFETSTNAYNCPICKKVIIDYNESK